MLVTAWWCSVQQRYASRALHKYATTRTTKISISQTVRQPASQPDKQTDRPTDRQTDRQMSIFRGQAMCLLIFLESITALTQQTFNLHLSISTDLRFKTFSLYWPSNCVSSQSILGTASHLMSQQSKTNIQIWIPCKTKVKFGSNANQRSNSGTDVKQRSKLASQANQRSNLGSETEIEVRIWCETKIEVRIQRKTLIEVRMHVVEKTCEYP